MSLFGRRKRAVDGGVLHSPNVARLHEKRDLMGLLNALYYGGTDEKTLKIRMDAAERLAAYGHVEVVRQLMAVAKAGEGAPMSCAPRTLRTWALRSAERMLYPYHQKDIVEWWFGGEDRTEEVCQILERNRASARRDERAAACRRIDDRVGTPAHIAATMHAAIYDHDDVSPDELGAVKRWRDQADTDRAPLYQQAQADLEAKWASQDADWASEEADLAAWRMSALNAD